MMFSKLEINAIIGLMGGLLGALFGDLNGILIALIIFMSIDYITGVLAAVYLKELNSSIGFKGLLKKAAILLVVIVAHTLDAYVLKQGSACRSAVILFYLSNEGISILENYNKMGLPFPAKLKEILASLKDK